MRPVSENRGEGVNAFIPAAKSLLVKDICTTTVSGSDVMVMCDPSTVRSHPTKCFRTSRKARLIDRIRPATKCIGSERRRFQMLER